MNRILFIVFNNFQDFEFFYHKIFSKRNLQHEYYSAGDIESNFLIDKRSRLLPLIAMIAGMTGIVLALLFQFWTSASDYPLNLSGKPFFSLLISIPITFEFMVLSSILTILIAFIFLSRTRLKEPAIEKEIKKLILQGKSVLKVDAEVLLDDFFRKNLQEFINDEKVIVHKNYE